MTCAIDWWCFYNFVRNSLVALLEASCARNVTCACILGCDVCSVRVY